MPGQGIFRVWRDGKLWFEDRTTKTLFDSSSYSDRGHILGLYEEVGPSVEQSVWIDDVIITNDRPNNTDAHGNPFIGMGNVQITAAPPIIDCVFDTLSQRRRCLRFQPASTVSGNDIFQ